MYKSKMRKALELLARKTQRYAFLESVGCTDDRINDAWNELCDALQEVRALDPMLLNPNLQSLKYRGME